MLFSNETKKNALNGAVSGYFSMFFLQPLQVLRTSMIIESSSSNKITIYKMFIKVIKSEGFAGLYRGFIPAVLKTTTGSAIYFGSLELGKNHLDKHCNVHIRNMLAGAFGRLIQNTFTNPILIVKTRNEVIGFNSYNSFLEGFGKIMKQEGFKGYFKGLKPNLIKDIPFSAVFYPLYEFFKICFSYLGFKSFYSLSCLSSLCTNVICVTLTNPLEVIRTRTQYLHFSKNENHNYSTGLAKGAVKIYELEGISGLLTGVYLRFMKKALASMMVWTLYEGLKLESENKKKL